MFQSSGILEMQSQLDERTEECGLLKTTIESLKTTNTDLQAKIDTLMQKIKDVSSNYR